jgi:hypothetical protein
VSGGCDVWKSKCLTLNGKIKKINGEFCYKNCINELPTVEYIFLRVQFVVGVLVAHFLKTKDNLRYISTIDFLLIIHNLLKYNYNSKQLKLIAN